MGDLTYDAETVLRWVELSTRGQLSDPPGTPSQDAQRRCHLKGLIFIGDDGLCYLTPAGRKTLEEIRNDSQ